MNFNSANGMNTNVWGPLLWTFLHTMSFNYPVCPTATQKREYKKFVDSLENILPCGTCRENLKTNLVAAKYNASVFENREKFSRFIYRLHNSVNKMLGKKKYKTYTRVREDYEQFRARSSDASEHEGCTQSRRPLKCKISIVEKQ